MTGRPFEIVNLLENNDATIGSGTTTISPVSPPIAETTTTTPLPISQLQPILTQLRGPSSLPDGSSNEISSTTSTRSSFSNSHSNPVATMDYTPDGNFSSTLITATLCLAWMFIAAVALLLLYWVCRVVKRRRALDSAISVQTYLKRYDEHDVRILKSSLGGWHVVFGRRLADRVRYYWTKELPGADEASTILFDDDQTLPSHHTSPSPSVAHEVLSQGGSDTLSCGSLSSDDQGVVPPPDTGPPTSRRGQVLAFQAIAFQEARDDVVNPDRQRRCNTCLSGSYRHPDKHQVQSFIHTQFPSDKILLSESLPTGGFSAIYCNQLEASNNDAYHCDRIEFYPSPSIDMDRIHDCSQPLFKDNFDNNEDDLETVLT